MAEDMAQAPDPLRDRAQVRIFTLADYVAEESSGRLYISGAGLECSGVPARTGLLPRLCLVIRIAYPMAMARGSHVVEVRALDAEDHPIGPDPLFRAKVTFDLAGAPAGAKEMSGNLPVQVTDYPVTVEPNDVIFLRLLVDGTEISNLPVQLVSIDS